MYTPQREAKCSILQKKNEKNLFQAIRNIIIEFYTILRINCHRK